MWCARHRSVVAVQAVLLAAGTFVVVGAAPAQAAVTLRLRAAVADLPVAAETRAGYARAKFPHWVDADRDCQDTRSEVLRAESRAAVSGRCAVATGRWVSPYDRATWTKASDVDIDHLVPLAEAWDSGAKRWTTDTRRRFANDLADRRSLVAVTDNVNQAKGDQDPADWLPRYGKCGYVKAWVAVKIRWSLKVDRAEKRALTRVANGCTNTTITVTKARIAKSTSGSGGGTDGGTDPQFATCADAKAAGYGPYVQGRDPEYDWYRDADNDGIVCE